MVLVILPVGGRKGTNNTSGQIHSFISSYFSWSMLHIKRNDRKPLLLHEHYIKGQQKRKIERKPQDVEGIVYALDSLCFPSLSLPLSHLSLFPSVSTMRWWNQWNRKREWTKNDAREPKQRIREMAKKKNVDEGKRKVSMSLFILPFYTSLKYYSQWNHWIADDQETFFFLILSRFGSICVITQTNELETQIPGWRKKRSTYECQWIEKCASGLREKEWKER